MDEFCFVLEVVIDQPLGDFRLEGDFTRGQPGKTVRLQKPYRSVNNILFVVSHACFLFSESRVVINDGRGITVIYVAERLLKNTNYALNNCQAIFIGWIY
jgi:hypothetical protein